MLQHDFTDMSAAVNAGPVVVDEPSHALPVQPEAHAAAGVDDEAPAIAEDAAKDETTCRVDDPRVYAIADDPHLLAPWRDVDQSFKNGSLTNAAPFLQKLKQLIEVGARTAFTEIAFTNSVSQTCYGRYKEYRKSWQQSREQEAHNALVGGGYEGREQLAKARSDNKKRHRAMEDDLLKVYCSGLEDDPIDVQASKRVIYPDGMPYDRYTLAVSRRIDRTYKTDIFCRPHTHAHMLSSKGAKPTFFLSSLPFVPSWRSKPMPSKHIPPEASSAREKSSQTLSTT